MRSTNATSARATPLVLERRAATRVFNMATPLLDRHLAEGRGERPALRLDGRTVSYRELHELDESQRRLPQGRLRPDRHHHSRVDSLKQRYVQHDEPHLLR